MKAIIGKKVGMTQIYEENGNVTPVTILDVSENFISKVLNTDGKVSHIELGKDKVKKPSKADLGNYKVLNFVPRFKKVLKLKTEETLEEGSEVKADVFAKGDKINVTGVSKGKGFQSVIKRWNFAGGPATHGASDRERAPGSLGTRTIPGRVFKGKKMGGHMGMDNMTIKNLKIAYVDAAENLIAVAGSIPGSRNSYVIIKGK